MRITDATSERGRGDRHIHPQTWAKGATEDRLNRGAKVCVPGIKQNLTYEEEWGP